MFIIVIIKIYRKRKGEKTKDEKENYIRERNFNLIKAND